jgi:hypothetical protein
MSGVYGHFRSRPITLTEAIRLCAQYEATGTDVKIECIEELATLHRRVIRGDLTFQSACDYARGLGYDV